MSLFDTVMKEHDPLQPRYHGKFIPKNSARPLFTPAFGGNMKPVQAQVRRGPDPLAAILGAMLLHALETTKAKEDMSPGLKALVKLIRDRGGLARLLGQPEASVQKAYWAAEERAWDHRLHPRDDQRRFVSRDLIQEARDDPKVAHELRQRVTSPVERNKLERAISGQADVGLTKRGTARDARKTRRRVATEAIQAVRRLRRHFLSFGVTPAELHHFAQILTHLKPEELSQTAKMLEQVVRLDDRQQHALVERLSDYAREHTDDGSAPEPGAVEEAPPEVAGPGSRAG